MRTALAVVVLSVFVVLPISADARVSQLVKKDGIELLSDDSGLRTFTKAEKASSFVSSCEDVDLSNPEFLIKLRSVNSKKKVGGKNQLSSNSGIDFIGLKKRLAHSSKSKVKNISQLIPQSKHTLRRSKQTTSTNKNYDLDRIFKISFEPNLSKKTLVQHRKKEYSCDEVENYIKLLNDDPDIEYAEPDYKLSLDLIPNDLDYSRLWGIKKVRAPEAWDVNQGDGVIVAVIDTGVDYNHPDLWNNIWLDSELVFDSNEDGLINLDDVDLNGNKIIDPEEFIPGMLGYDYHNNDADPMDDHFHGTHVSGTIAADANEIGVIGVAPQAKIMPLKFLSASGSGSSSNAILALVYAAEHGAQLSNNSWGGGGASQALEEAFNYAVDLGMINIAAAGNDNRDAGLQYPAAYESVIAVAATDINNQRASFSNYGSVVDISAPGVNVYSTSLNSTYTYASGTSMASPHVAGLVALILKENPNLSREQVLGLLQSHSISLSTDQYIGSGLIDSYASLLNISNDVPIANINSLPSFEEISQGEIEISGTADSLNFDHYRLGIYENLDSLEALVSIESYEAKQNTSLGILDLSGIENNAQYILKLEVFNNSTDSSFSVKPIDIILKAPKAPTDIYRLDDPSYSDTKAYIRWNQSRFNPNEITHYLVYRRNLTTGENELISNKPVEEYPVLETFDYYEDKFLFVDKGLEPNTSYYYTVAAKNSIGESVLSDEILVSTSPEKVKEPYVTNFAYSDPNQAYLGGSDGELPADRFGGAILDMDFDEAGDLYVLDRRILKKIDMKTGQVTSLVGTNNLPLGSIDGSFDSAKFYWPVNIDYSPEEKVIYVNEYFSGYINGQFSQKYSLRKVDLNTQTVSTLFTETGEQVSSYSRVISNKNGDLVMLGSNKVDKLNPDGTVSPWIGARDLEEVNYKMKDGLGTEAILNSAGAFAYDSNADIFYFIDSGIDMGKYVYALKRLDKDGRVSTVSEYEGSSYFRETKNGKFPDVNLAVTSMKVNNEGDLIIADPKSKVRKINLENLELSTIAGSESIEDALNFKQLEAYASEVLIFEPEAIAIDVNNDIYVSSSFIANDRRPGSLSYRTSGIKKIIFDLENRNLVPKQVNNLSYVYKASSQSVKLTWSKPDFDSNFSINSYKVYRGNNPNIMQEVAETENTSFTDSNLEPGTDYVYKIVALNNMGEGSSALLSFKTEPLAEPTPVPIVLPNPVDPAFPSPSPDEPDHPTDSPAPEVPLPEDPVPPVEEPPTEEPIDPVRQVIPKAIEEIKSQQDIKALVKIYRRIDIALKQEVYDLDLDLDKDGDIDSDDKLIIAVNLEADTELTKTLEALENIETNDNGKITKKIIRQTLKAIKEDRKILNEKYKDSDQLPEELLEFDINDDQKITKVDFNYYKKLLKISKKVRSLVK